MESTISIGDKEVVLTAFPAFDGFELNRRYRTDYKMQSDSMIRARFALDVLSFATYKGETLSTVDAVNKVCGTWKNLEKVFYGMLEFNNIDIELKEEKAHWFEYAGSELAISFIGEATRLMAPFLNSLSEEAQDG